MAFEVALEIIRSLRGIVGLIRRRSPKLANQIEESASSVAANLAEGNRRRGKDRFHFFSIAAGSADETRAHLLVAEGWGWVTTDDIHKPLQLIDRELGLIWGLTH